LALTWGLSAVGSESLFQFRPWDDPELHREIAKSYPIGSTVYICGMCRAAVEGGNCACGNVKTREIGDA
jgi:hypothetical protein